MAYYKKTLWKQSCPPSVGAERRRWQEQVKARLSGTRGAQDLLLRAWGFKPYQRVDKRNLHLRRKLSGLTMRARFRELQVFRYRQQRLSFRQIGQRLGISHVAAYKRFWWAMQECDNAEWHRQRNLNKIREQVALWEKYFRQKAAGSMCIR